jgi:hypothetical protein
MNSETAMVEVGSRLRAESSGGSDVRCAFAHKFEAEPVTKRVKATAAEP